MSVSSKVFQEIIGEVVREKESESENLSKQDIEEEVRKYIDFDQQQRFDGNFISARDNREFIGSKDEYGNIVGPGEGGEHRGEIVDIWFNHDLNKERPLVDLEQFREKDNGKSDLNSVISDYEDFYNSPRHKNEEYKWENVRDFREAWKEASGKSGEEFYEVLNPVFQETNLLGWGKTTLQRKFNDEPEEASEVIKDLLDENGEIYERISRFKEFFDQPNAGGTKVASYFLSSLYPERYIYFKFTEDQEFVDDLGIELDKEWKNYDDRVQRYLDFNEKMKEVLEEINLDDKDLWNVQDLIWFYTQYWMPEDLKSELESIKNRAGEAYTRLFALKCFFEAQEEGSISGEEFDDVVREKAEKESLPGENKSAYVQLNYNVFRNYEAFTASDDEYGVKEDYQEYLDAMSHYVDYLWSQVSSETEYFLISHNNHPEQFEDGYLKAPYTEDSDSYDGNYTPTHDLSRISSGDKIFHFKDGEIKGYSTASRTPEVKGEGDEREYFLKVDINKFDSPKPFSEFEEEMKKDWDRVGKNYALEKREDHIVKKSTGYLKVLSEETAQAILEKSKGNNHLENFFSDDEFDIDLPNSLYFENEHQLRNKIEASLNSGKNIIFTGPPGTGKTKLAKSISTQVSGDEEKVEGSLFTTATADWTAFDTIGGYMPSQDGGDELEFNPGQFLKCFRKENGEVTNKWLVIDEINRSDIDKAFGQLFSVLSGDSVELPYKKDGHVKLEKVESEQDLQQVESDEDIYPVTDSWRLIATMNTYDKTSLYDMSYAFMRRFNFVHVGVPDLENDEGYRTELLDPDEENYSSVWEVEDVLSEDALYEDLTVLWAEVNRQRDIGPSIIKDIIEFVDAHSGENSLALAQAVNSLILPQFEGLRREKQKEFVNKLREKQDDDELSLNVFLVKEKASNMFNIDFEDD